VFVIRTVIRLSDQFKLLAVVAVDYRNRHAHNAGEVIGDVRNPSHVDGVIGIVEGEFFGRIML